jgi:hypothetical protein
VARFLSVDPLAPSYSWNTPYSFAENDVIRAVDLDGLERFVVIYNQQGDAIRKVDFYDIEEGAHGPLGYGILQFYSNGLRLYSEDGTMGSANIQFTGDEFVEKVSSMVRLDKGLLYEMGQKHIEERLANSTNIRAAERYTIRRFPLSAIKTEPIVDIVINVSHRSSDQITVAQILGDAHNGRTDAIRHAFLNAALKLFSSATFAEEISTAHEQDRPDQPLNEKLMDLHNNAVGRSIGGQTLQEVYNGVIDRAASGELMIYDSGKDTLSRFTLSDEEVSALKSIQVGSSYMNKRE